jgi:hypothetical protein
MPAAAAGAAAMTCWEGDSNPELVASMRVGRPHASNSRTGRPSGTPRERGSPERSEVGQYPARGRSADPLQVHQASLSVVGADSRRGCGGRRPSRGQVNGAGLGGGRPRLNTDRPNSTLMLSERTCSKCGGNMGVREDPATHQPAGFDAPMYRNGRAAKEGALVLRAISCTSCGYVEFYLDSMPAP